MPDGANNNDSGTGGSGTGGDSGRSRDERRGRSRDDDDDDRGRRGRGPSDEGRGVAQKLLRRFRGKAEDAVAELADENRELRDERRELKVKLDSYTKPGTIVLTGDDAKEHTELKALGKAADVKKQLDELPGLRTKVQDTETRTAASSAAQLLKWNSDATAAAIVDKKLVLSLVDGQDKDGKAIKIPHVKPAGADDKTASVPLVDWVKTNAAYLMPALTAAAPGTTSGAGTSAGGTNNGAGRTQYVDQSGGDAGTARNASSTAAAIPGRPKFQTPGQRAAANQTGGTK